MNITEFPSVGQPMECGIFAGITSTVDGHFAVALLADKPDGDLTWTKSMNWAEKLGATLPSRPVAAMLFANLKAHLKPSWIWTNEEFSIVRAWVQSNRDEGRQFNWKTTTKLPAIAVRLIQLTA